MFALLADIIRETGTVSRNIPGWNYYIKHFKCIASFWKELWRGNYSPVSRYVHEIMRKSRAEYNNGIRPVISEGYIMRKQQFARALS